MASSSRPKWDTKEPDRFTPWEEGDTSMIGVKKAKSRERKKNKNYMMQYREKASKDTEGSTVGPDGRDRIVFRFQYIKALMLTSIFNRS